MMTQLIRIGNSQGLRIPKPLIEQADLANKELFLEVVAGGLLIRPAHPARSGWADQIQTTLQTQGAEVLDYEWLDAPLHDEDGLWE